MDSAEFKIRDSVNLQTTFKAKTCLLAKPKTPSLKPRCKARGLRRFAGVTRILAQPKFSPSGPRYKARSLRRFAALIRGGLTRYSCSGCHT